MVFKHNFLIHVFHSQFYLIIISESIEFAFLFVGDGNYCITCGSDKSVKLWNPHREVLLKTYSGHGYEVLDAQASCDNSQICSCGMDKSVVVFDVATGNAVRKYRGHAGKV